MVRAGGAILAETRDAVVLEEQGHEPVHYIPRADVGTEFLDPSDKRTTCPHKGEAAHYHIIAKSGPITDAAWSYEQPIDGAEQIRGFMAFYPGKALVEEL